MSKPGTITVLISQIAQAHLLGKMMSKLMSPLEMALIRLLDQIKGMVTEFNSKHCRLAGLQMAGSLRQQAWR